MARHLHPVQLLRRQPAQEPGELGTEDYGDGLHRTISYSYDADGNRAGMQYPSSYAFSYSYSGRNQLQTVAQGGSGQLATYGYDASGNLKMRTLANSTSSTYGYDEMNRVLNISHALSGTTRTFDYGYNAVGNRTYVQRDMGMGDVFGYDKNDQMTAVLLNIANPATTGPGGQTVYYDESGNRSYFGAESQSDVYAVNQLNQYSSRDVGVPPTPTPTPTATPTPSATPTPGPADAPTIDPDGQTTCPNPVLVTIQSDTPGAHLRVVRGGLDADINDGVETEGNLYQICVVMPVYPDPPIYYKAKAFLPDMEETTSSTVVVSGMFQVPQGSDCGGGGGGCEENGPLRPAGGDDTTATATYNGNGAMTSNFDGSVYTYDSMNRLLSASKGGVNVKYYYDGLNRQIARTVNGVATYSVYDGWNLIGEYSSGSTTASLAWVYGAAGMIKELVSGNYYYQDGLGSTSHLADSTGNLLEWYRYDLQGAPIFYDASDNVITASAYRITHLYTGQRWYSALGLYDLRNRYYSPNIGRFLQPDPIGFNGDASNLYRYAGNNPVNESDRYGLLGGTGYYQHITVKSNEPHGPAVPLSFALDGISGGGPGGAGDARGFYQGYPDEQGNFTDTIPSDIAHGIVRAPPLGGSFYAPGTFPAGYSPLALPTGGPPSGADDPYGWDNLYRFLETPATQAQKDYTNTGRTPTLVATAAIFAPLAVPQAAAPALAAGGNVILTGANALVSSAAYQLYLHPEAVAASYYIIREFAAPGLPSAESGSLLIAALKEALGIEGP